MFRRTFACPRPSGQENCSRSPSPAFAVYGTLFTMRAYPHYLQQSLLPLIVLLAVLLTRLPRLPRPTLSRRVDLGRVLRPLPGFAVASLGAWLLMAVYVPWPNWARWEKV